MLLLFVIAREVADMNSRGSDSLANMNRNDRSKESTDPRKRLHFARKTGSECQHDEIRRRKTLICSGEFASKQREKRIKITLTKIRVKC